MSLQPRRSFARRSKARSEALPRTITLDGYAASNRAVRDMQAGGQLPAGTKLRSSKYLNNLIEQDHRGVKLRIDPMLGFKRFEAAAVTIAGIELLRQIHKGQFNLRRLASRKGRSAPAIWNAVRWRYDTQQIALNAQIGQLCLSIYLHQNRLACPAAGPCSRL